MLTVTYSLADQNFLTTKSVGIFNLSRHLLEHLARRPEMAALTVLSNPTLNGVFDVPSHTRMQQHPNAIGGRLGRILWDQTGVYRAAAHAGHDWLFLPKGFASFSRRCPVKLALYVHDTILQSYYEKMPGMSRLERIYFHLCFRANLKWGDLIITNTDFTIEEVRRTAQRYGLKSPPMVNAGIGFTRPAVSSPQQSRIMVLASPLPHKRTALAVDYLSRWQGRTGYSGTVVWVGRFPEGVSMPSHPNWRHEQRLPEKAFRDLLHGSMVLVFFSDYEGFGMPPVEAALAGVCPVYSDLPSTREVMAGAGLAFRNEDYASFAHALSAAFQVPAAERAGWAEQLAARHHWPEVARRVAEALLEFGPAKSGQTPVTGRLPN